MDFITRFIRRPMKSKQIPSSFFYVCIIQHVCDSVCEYVCIHILVSEFIVPIYTHVCCLQYIPQHFSQEHPSPPCCLSEAAEGAAPGQRWGRNPDCWSRLPPESGHTPPPPTERWETWNRGKWRVGGGWREQERHSITHWDCLWTRALLLSFLTFMLVVYLLSFSPLSCSV